MTASAPLGIDSSSDTVAPRFLIRPHRWKVFGASWVVFALLSILWACATPLSASPDEPAHIIKAASVARGQFIGENSSYGPVVQVPRYIALTHTDTCFAFHPELSADCVVPNAEDPAEIVDAPTSAGLYNPVYYLMVGWPSLLIDNAGAIYAMRVVSAIFTTLFLAFTTMMLFGLRRNVIPLAGLAIAVPPMLLFLSSSVNPNAIEITATLAVFVAMFAIVTEPNSKLLTERASILALGAAIAANTRGLSPLWVAIAIFAPLIVTSWSRIWALLKKPQIIWAVCFTGVTTAFAAAWLVSTNSLTAAQDDPDYFQSFPGVGSSPLSGFWLTIRDTFGYAQSMIANFGWLDTPAPPLVYFIWAVLVGSLLVAAFCLLRGRAAVLGGVLVALYLLLPAVIQGAYITGGGLIWQGRYTLPLFAMLVIGLALLVAQRVDQRAGTVLNRMTFLVWGATALAQLLSFVYTLRRYSVGADGSLKSMVFTPEWSAPGGNALWLVLYSVVLASSFWAAWRLTRISTATSVGVKEDSVIRMPAAPERTPSPL